MRRFVLIFIASFTMVVLPISCGPPSQYKADESKRCVPHSLTLDKISNRYAVIAWNPGCPGTRILRGYNIYLSPVPLTEQHPRYELPQSIKPFNREIYPGDTVGDPNRETYECEDISNATVYYAHVRTVYNDNSLSLPTNEIEVVSYAQGEIELAVSYSGKQDGFSFEKNNYCGTDDIENDIYFYSKDGKDYLCSPLRLGPVNRPTKIYPAGEGSTLGNISDIRPSGDPLEKVELRKGGIYIIITEEDYPVKLRAAEITGSGDDRKIRFEYIYKPPVKRQGGISS
jgi:hypothetical protein